MAKAKDFSEIVDQTPSDRIGSVALDAEMIGVLAENESKQAEIDALRAELARMRSDTAVYASHELPQKIDGSWPKFLVKVEAAPEWVVQAPHAGLAFEAYKRVTGLISSPHAPAICAADSLETGRHGI